MCRQNLLGSLSAPIPKKIDVQKIHPSAEFPTKEKITECGWDVTLVNRTQNRVEDEIGEINEFGTGLKFCPPEGYYLEVVANNTLHRQGYTLTGPVIIDRENHGELIVPLYKFREADDLALPFRAVRIIPRPLLYIHLSHNKKKVPKQGYDQNGYSDLSPDMEAYQRRVMEGYGPGVPRPQAIPRTGNHMF